MTRYIQVVTTTGDRDMAEKIARTVLDKRFAACVQISRCSSLYRWQGKIENDEEYLCVMKSREDLFPLLNRIIRQTHSYDVPEVIATPIVDGNPDYLGWLEQELLPVKEK